MMPTEASPAGDTSETHTLTVQIGGDTEPIRLALPAGALPPDAVLPALRSVADAVVQRAIAAAEAKGRTISCKPGCAACCRHLVLISDVEARALAALVEGAPEPRRRQLRTRFAAAHDRLLQSGLAERAGTANPLSAKGLLALARDYFRAGIDCPFLEDERCSIYADRPLVCRRIVATTPAERCADPDDDRVQVLRLPMLSAALLLLTSEEDPPQPAAMPLLFALTWAESNPPAVPPRGADVWMRRFVQRLAETQT